MIIGTLLPTNVNRAITYAYILLHNEEAYVLCKPDRLIVLYEDRLQVKEKYWLVNDWLRPVIAFRSGTNADGWFIIHYKCTYTEKDEKEATEWEQCVLSIDEKNRQLHKSSKQQ